MRSVNFTYRFLLIAIAVTFSCFFSSQAPAFQTQPNIILIMTDDQGWGDVEFAQQLSPSPNNPADQTYSGHPELKTPALAEMATRGMLFNKFYSAGPVCSPTRASFITGRHHRRMRVDHANVGRMLNREVTISELAKTVGYTTGHFGKWHLGAMDKSIHSVDSNRGGTSRLPGAANIFAGPWNDRYDTVFATESKTNTFNPTDINPTTHYWEGFEQSLATTDPSLNGDDSRVMMDRVVPFLQNAVINSEPFLATIWFHTPHKPYNIIDQGTLNEFYSTSEQNQMDTNERGYYACLTAMDKQVGRLRQQLIDLGVADNTIVLFTSDNGPEDGVPGVNDVAKGNLRGNKRDLWEGGVRVPTIIEWPGEIAPGSNTDFAAGVIDLLPTLVELWGIEMPDDRPIDGESILPVLRGNNATSRDSAMFWDFQSARSILDPDGRFKAISTNNGGTWQLYDLIADPKETINLAGSNPTLLNSLVDQWNTWRTEVDTHRTVESDYRTYIASTSNADIENDSPPSFLPADTASNVPVVVTEKQFYMLTSDTPVDADGTGAYDTNNEPTGALVPAGQTVHSYLLRLSPTQTTQQDFSVTFNNEILGVISSEPLLEVTDFFAYANPTFFDTTSGDTLRGMDFHSSVTNDAWSISADGKTISVTMQSTTNTLDEIRVITRTEAIGTETTVVSASSSAAARLLANTTNSRDDNNGGGGTLNLIGVNTEGVENYTIYRMDLSGLAGQVTSGATVSVTSATLNNSNHGSSNDFILLSSLAPTNAGYVNGGGVITGDDNLTNDGSISFLNRIQYNDSPGPPAGTTLPWLDSQGAPVANLLGAVTQAAIIPGFDAGDAPSLSFDIDQAMAQGWLDNGLAGFLVSAIDDGDGRSRFAVTAGLTISFDIEVSSFVPPANYTRFRGVDSGANALSDFADSDNVFGAFLPGFVLNATEAPVWLIFDGIAGDATEFSIESKANTPGLDFTVEAWNWNNSSYDVIGNTPESFNVDAVNEFAIDAQNHIDTGGDVRARVGWRRIGFTILFPWEIQVDQTGWVQ